MVTFAWIAVPFCSLQAYCFVTATHPALNPFVVWGLLPSTDSRHYLNSAVEIAEGVGMRSGFGARQMWPGFLALLHTWCHGDLKLMLSLLTLMQAAVAFTTWEMVRELLGRSAAFIWLCCVTLFYRTYVTGVFMTEQLGLPLGMLAAVILLYAWRRRSFGPWLIGLSFLTFGLSARPGCYFVLGFLIAGTFWRFRSTASWMGRWRRPVETGRMPRVADSPPALGFYTLAWAKGLISASLVGMCLTCNTLSYLHLVNPPRMPSNYWLVLYGIAKGGSWADSFKDLGQGRYDLKRLSTVNEQEDLYDFLSRVKQAAIKEIRAKPEMLEQAAGRAWRDVIVNQTFFNEDSARWWAPVLFLMSATALLLGVFGKKAGFGDGCFYWLVWLGIWFSLPLVPPWDSGGRTYAATNPLIWLTPAVFCSRCAGRIFGKGFGKQVEGIKRVNTGPVEAGSYLRINTIIGGLLVISSVVLPSILLEFTRNRTMPRYSDLISLETSTDTIHDIPQSLITHNRGIMIGPANTRTFLPWVAREDFERGVPRGREIAIGEFMKELPNGAYIALLGRPRYLFCDSSAFQNGLGNSNVPLQENEWMAYKYIISVSKSMVLTPTQVMILCPAFAGHEIFWKSSISRTKE